MDELSKSQHQLALHTHDDERREELKAFDDTKAGVKGLVDAGVTKIPRIFINPPGYGDNHDYNEKLVSSGVGVGAGDDKKQLLKIPTIDLEHCMDNKKVIIDEIRRAAETWGFFQIVNHGIPIEVFDEMIERIRRFNEQPNEAKKEFYTRDMERKVRFNSNFDLFYAPAANWRDTLQVDLAPNPPTLEELPLACRDIIIEYSKHVMKLGAALFELLSEGLGLNPNHLSEIGCSEGLSMLCHYYPACPEPELTWGAPMHSDKDFLTVVLQDHIAGLQVLHKNQWIEVPPIHGALVLVSNNRLKSVEHKVVASHEGPRISVASFFSTNVADRTTRVFEPIKELVSDESPALYAKTTVADYLTNFLATARNGNSALSHLKLF
ncbi:hypothetical protein Sjap_000609 [Stephania japonica]|uniref:Fe2OG dioxygenase domain-containing protein n=1 Tax=Stephania japonica TaxID=461633 RepID=A0AAP0PSN3_9MAGN